MSALNLKEFFHLKPLQQCASYLHSCWLSVSPSLFPSKLIARCKRNRTRLRTAIQDTLIIQRASLIEIVSSKRFAVGLTLILIGLLCKYMYLLFDSTVRSDWYFQGAYWFLWTIRLQLNDILFSIGVFLLFPVKVKLRYVVYFHMFSAVQDIFHYSIFTKDFETFHQPFMWAVTLIGLMLPVFLLIIADYMCYRKYHLKYGPFATIMGIIQTPVPAEKKIEVIEQSGVKIQDFYARY